MMRKEDKSPSIKVEFSLESDDYALLEIVTKHYGVSNTDRTPNDMAAIIVKNALNKMLEQVQRY